MSEKKEKNAEIKILIIKLSVFLAVAVLISFFCYHLIKNYLLGSENFQNFISEHKFIGSVIVIFICAFQVVVAFIPGEFVEIGVGYVFGALYGSFLCLAGTMIGSVIAVMLTRKFGRTLVYSLYSKEKLEKNIIFRDKIGRNLLTFIVFLIPGTPKDFLTYAIGLTDMSILTYVLLTATARYPSIISSCLGGDALGRSRFAEAVIIMGITLGLSIIGLLIYRMIVIRKNRNKENDNTK